MGFGPSQAEQNGRPAYFIDKILHGASPSDMPVESPKSFEFVVNVHTLQAMGLSLPAEVAGQVTEWIQ
jgi:putative ABC transport system substrate-binding protein